MLDETNKPVKVLKLDSEKLNTKTKQTGSRAAGKNATDRSKHQSRVERIGE